MELSEKLELFNRLCRDSIATADGCFLWQRPGVYIQLRWKGSVRRLHRLALELVGREEGKVSALCGDLRCWNPEHLVRFASNGIIMRMPIEVCQYIFSQVLQIEGCWIWPGSTRRGGYGRIRCQDKSVLTHRLVYEQMVGPIPEGLQLDHLCNNRLCCNPKHLEPVTPAENNRRARARQSALKGELF